MKITMNYEAAETAGGCTASIAVIAEDGSLLGTFRRDTTIGRRNPNGSYYDAHRAAKGDTTTYTDHAIAWSGDPALGESIITTLCERYRAERIAAGWGNLYEGYTFDAYEQWKRLCESARGFRYNPSGYAKKDARRKEIEAANKARMTAVVEF